MSQYRPDYEVGQIAVEGRRDAGAVRYQEVNRVSFVNEIDAAHEAARAAGLWRLDQRVPTMPLM